ncbi:hypothetical protein AVEN_177857-1 [Araneus ventricosus]|uniref:Uncharacterized protein n=1 Tax=Araneus ventricosus TaxID=182803 RepID=A0A4Y2KRQ0_ARAVE|nr:hypothetical protein AVEN_177857-1 [Araneus ventricosus]
MGKRVHIGYRDDELFRKHPIDEKVNRVCLKHLQTAQLESESLQIKDFSQQKMIGNLVNDLKMVKNELRFLQGDIKNFKEGRHLFLQIQEKNKNVENSKIDNDSLVKENAYYDKKKSGKVSLRKGDIVAIRRNPNTAEPRKGRLYATIAHVSQLKAWRSCNEDDDDSAENSDDEPGMQRPKRTIRKPVRYGGFMPDR